MKVCRKANFNAAHRLFNPNWSNDKNTEVFGKCNNPNYHGHNYKIEVWVEGDINPETGFVINLKDLKEIIKTQIIDAFDHRNLNLDTQEFKNLNPTAENIALVCWQKIDKALDQKFPLTVRLWETENNVVEYSGT
jgi:6-pyruvoyltetrahydropterin/6-carboxytetrahydropterin synthase